MPIFKLGSLNIRNKRSKLVTHFMESMAVLLCVTH